MKKFNLINAAVLFVTVLALSSCSSDGSGDSDGTSTGNYLPLAVGNKWNYTNGSTATLDQIIGTATFGGVTYYEDDDSAVEIDIQNWVVKKGASYYQKAGTTTQVQGSITIVTAPYEIKQFRDDLAVGEKWHGSASPKVTYSGSSSGSFNAHINYEGTITARDVSETLGGVTYNNIIKTQMVATVNSNGQINTINSEYWFAKDIGIIYDSTTSTVDNVTKTRYLTSYELH